MKLSKKIPSIYPRLKQVFNINWDDGVIITYGDTVYCKYDLNPDKIIHENVHIKQQESGVEAWWDRYIDDPKFRLEQELEAYRAEVKFIRGTIKNREAAFRKIRQICLDLSSEMYGNIISYQQAYLLLK